MEEENRGKPVSLIRWFLLRRKNEIVVVRCGSEYRVKVGEFILNYKLQRSITL